MNILDYQEDVGQGSGDLLEYAEPWGGSQNSGFKPKKNDGQEWKPMTQQGERPENDADFYKDPYASEVGSGSGILVPEGELESRPKNQGGGYEQEKFTPPKNRPPANGLDRDTFPIGFPPVEDFGTEIPYDQAIYLASQEFDMNMEDKLKIINEKLSSDQFEKKVVDNVFKSLANNKRAASVADQAIASGIDSRKDRIVLSSLDDLFSFNRVATNTLIHKSSQDLWKIGTDESGQTYIEQLYTNDGQPLKG